MWLQVEEVATTDFYWLKMCALHFQTFSRVIPLSQYANQNQYLFSECILRLNSRCRCHTLCRRVRGPPLLAERGEISGAERGEVFIPAGYPATESPLLAERAPLHFFFFNLFLLM
jgi:hypothetical protein